MSEILYNIGITLMHLTIRLAKTVGSIKAKQWIDGRKNWKQSFNNINNQQKTIWIHAASHGEGLMAIPLIKKII